MRLSPKDTVKLLFEYEKVKKNVNEKFYTHSLVLGIVAITLIISFTLIEITKLGLLGKIILPLLLLVFGLQIFLLSKNYNDKKLFFILSALLNKDDVKDSSNILLKVKRISEEFNDIPLPAYATDGSSGLDIRAAVKNEIIIPKGKHALVPTNLQFEIPDGYEIQVRPRSGLAANYGIGLLNSPGTIDSDYRGEVKIILFNFGENDFVVKRGDRIAQIVLSKVCKAELKESNELNSSTRGSGGFGHTGSH